MEVEECGGEIDVAQIIFKETYPASCFYGETIKACRR